MRLMRTSTANRQENDKFMLDSGTLVHYCMFVQYGGSGL